MLRKLGISRPSKSIEDTKSEISLIPADELTSKSAGTQTPASVSGVSTPSLPRARSEKLSEEELAIMHAECMKQLRIKVDELMLVEMANANNEEDATLAMKREKKYLEMRDQDLNRFLVARNHNVDNALELLKISEKWRIKNTPVDTSACLNEIRCGLAWISGHDKQGRALVYVDVTVLDKNTRDLEKTTNFAVWMISQAVESSMANNQEQICLLFDLANFGLKTMDYQLVKNLLFLLSNAFPERTAYLFIMNAPTLFKGFWSVIKPWIDEGTARKIQFLSVQQLVEREFADMDQLPEQLGGPRKFEPAM
mmetsp:Transcript_18317/g.31729  ORF Transcript_18317/g.31729 Transcript_18317/m.31729 type:complete len:310 (+) Transcript_18317:143-1072(+)